MRKGITFGSGGCSAVYESNLLWRRLSRSQIFKASQFTQYLAIAISLCDPLRQLCCTCFVNIPTCHVQNTSPEIGQVSWYRQLEAWGQIPITSVAHEMNISWDGELPQTLSEIKVQYVLVEDKKILIYSHEENKWLDLMVLPEIRLLENIKIPLQIAGNPPEYSSRVQKVTESVRHKNCHDFSFNRACHLQALRSTRFART